MPKKRTDDLFVAEPPEWTARKHKLLERYCVPAAQMMKEASKRKKIVLIDGFAGPNKYGNEVRGSTYILVQAALRVKKARGDATVYAFEVDKGRFQALSENLGGFIQQGVLKVINRSHAEGIHEVLQEIEEVPLFVFLDPQTPSQMSIRGDIAVYAHRPRTDVLGIFHACNAARIVSSCLNQENEHSFQVHPREFLGGNWKKASTEESATETFWGEICQMKRYCGLYQLRKKLKKHNAYAIFGFSDHPKGFYLLSDAVARDYEELEEHEKQLLGAGLYEELEKQADFDRLVEILSQFTTSVGKIGGRELALKAIEAGYGNKLFGVYTESDYNRAAKHIREQLKVSGDG